MDQGLTHEHPAITWSGCRTVSRGVFFLPLRLRELATMFAGFHRSGFLLWARAIHTHATQSSASASLVRVSGNVTSDRQSQRASYCRSQRASDHRPQWDSDRRSQRASDCRYQRDSDRRSQRASDRRCQRA